jgi:hypothetical protein
MTAMAAAVRVAALVAACVLGWIWNSGCFLSLFILFENV